MRALSLAAVAVLLLTLAGCRGLIPPHPIPGGSTILAR